MTSYSNSSARGFYRDGDRAVIGGVCAGLAGYFGLNLKVTRILAFIALLTAMPFALIAYLAAVMLIPAESGRDDGAFETRYCCWGIRRSSIAQARSTCATSRREALTQGRANGRSNQGRSDRTVPEGRQGTLQNAGSAAGRPRKTGYIAALSARAGISKTLINGTGTGP